MSRPYNDYFNQRHDELGVPAHFKAQKLTPRDRDLITEIWQNTPASRVEIAIAFGVSRGTIFNHTGKPKLV